MSAGSAAAQRAVDAFTNSRDRMDRANRQKKVDDLTAQLEGGQVETGFQAPTAQFGATDGPAPRMAGLSIGQQAPVGDVTVGGMSGAPTATGLEVNVPLAKGTRKRTRAETEALLGQIALAKGDHAGYATSLDRVRIAEMSQLDDEIAKTPLADIEGLLTKTNTNQSNLPVLYTGKDKNGYEITLLGDGGEPDSKFKLNEAQLRGLYRAQKLAEAGYGAESLAAMTGAHKEIGEHIARYNGLVSQNAQNNNTAMRYGNQDKHNADTLASQEAYRKEQGRLGWARLNQDGAHQRRMLEAQRDRRSGNLMEFVDAKGNTVLIDTGAAPRGADGVVGLPTGLTPKTVHPQLTPAERYKLAVDYAKDSGIKLGEALLEVESLYAAQSGGVPGAGGAGNPLVIPEAQAENKARQQPAPAPRQPAQLPPAMTLRQAQEAANRTNPPRDLSGLVLNPHGGSAYPGLEYLTR